MAFGPTAGLALLDAPDLAEPLDGYHHFHAARADFLRRAGDFVAASAAYRAALLLVTNVTERGYLERRLAEVS